MREILTIILCVLTQFVFAQSYEFTITGELSELRDKSGTLNYWDVDHRKNTFIDSLKIDSLGKLHYLAKEEPGLYVLSLDDVGSVYLAVDNNQKIQISYNSKKLSASGAKDVELLNAYEVFRKQSLSKWMDEVRSDIREARKSGKSSLMDSLGLLENQNYAAHRVELTRWVETSMGTSIAVYATSLRWSFSDVDFMQQLLPRFKRAHPNLNITRLLEDKVERYSRVAIGKHFVGFESNDPNGNRLSINSMNGKYMLIDFWASWCGPCRRENPHLVKIYNRYHQSGLEMIGVSLDKRSSRWTAAIEKDQLSWIQVSDLKGYVGEVPVMYNISAIPSNILIDPEGRIIAYNLFGKDLAQKLETLFGYEK